MRANECLPDVSWRALRPLLGVPLVDRARDVIDLAYQRYHKLKMKNAEKEGVDFQSLLSDDGLLECDEVVDFSQDGRRMCSAVKLRSMCSNASFYSFRERRAICPQEHLFLLGWPKSGLDLKTMSHHCIRDLGGESMAAPSIAVVLTCLALQSDLWVW